MKNAIHPHLWVAVAELKRPQLDGLSPWFDGTTAPSRAGWYERHFTDSTVIEPDASMQYWDGDFWRNRPGRTAHWRQMGDYPAWRGLAAPTSQGD